MQVDYKDRAMGNIKDAATDVRLAKWRVTTAEKIYLSDASTPDDIKHANKLVKEAAYYLNFAEASADYARSIMMGEILKLRVVLNAINGGSNSADPI